MDEKSIKEDIKYIEAEEMDLSELSLDELEKGIYDIYAYNYYLGIKYAEEIVKRMEPTDEFYC